MKKFVILAAALMLSAGMFAQNLWIGGEIGLNSSKANGTAWNVSPNVGYKFSDKISADISLSFGGNGNSTVFGIGAQGLYWISINDQFSYTPGVYLAYTSVGGTGIFGAGLKLVTFEYKMSEKISLGFEAGELGFLFPKDNTTINLGINAAPTLAFRYWF